MARARNIKPGLFKNEVLGVADPLYTLLFEGLWVLADREGRLEDRPLRIKGEIFPYRDGVDIAAMLDWLVAKAFIRRYEANGVAVIQIIAFAKHQAPHGTERDSELPDENGSYTVHERGKNGYATGAASLVNRALTVKEPSDNSLIPDSGFLIPEIGPVAEAPVKPSRKKAKSAMPEDFAPNDAGLKAARDAGLSLERELHGFRNYHLSKGSVMADWQAAWRSWVGKAIEFGRGSKGAGSGDWWTPAGFPDRWTAENDGCKQGNAHLFRDGKRIKETA